VKILPVRNGGFYRTKLYTMDVITIGDKKYFSIEKFMLQNNIRSNKTVYNWVRQGKVEQKNMFNTSFFRLK